MVLKNSVKKNSRKKLENNPKITKTYIDIFIIGILLLIDRLTKIFSISLNEPIKYKLLEITYVKNTGAGFSIFNNMNIFLVILSSIIALFIMYIYTIQNANLEIKKRNNNSKINSFLQDINIPRFSFLTIISGTLGNIIDRIVSDGVIDFINFRFFPIFNFADILISLGVAYWIIIIIKEK